MRVYKFGGASVKDAASVRNMALILSGYGSGELIVVVSAMSKTTNRLEQLSLAWHSGLKREAATFFEEIRNFHSDILDELLPDDKLAKMSLSGLFGELNTILTEPPPPSFDLAYEMVVPYGELFSTSIIWHYLKSQKLDYLLADARKIIITDETLREARINWEITTDNLVRYVNEQCAKGFVKLLIQGFIGSTVNGQTVTLGREGSDFTASIIAYALDAEEVTIWKDVPGLMNADPAIFPDAVLLNELSFHEAIELAYYGAKIIHPKTIKPLQNKSIPLRVKSFIEPKTPGSLIHDLKTYGQDIPSYIIKEQQALISFSPKDFSFIAERNISDIFSSLSALNIRANLMQNSAISFSVCLDDHEERTNRLIAALQDQFTIRYNRNLALVTIRHFTEDIIKGLIANSKVILEQRSRNTVQLVLR